MSKTVLYTGRGDFEVIAIVDREVRAVGAGEVRIAVKAAAVNPTDVLLRDPGYSTLPPPWVPGMDAAGIVESVGSGVSHVRVGDEVMAAVWTVRPDGGAQSEHIVVPAASVVRIPDGVSLVEASTLPMNGLTAFLALELAGLERGRILAVSGGAGLLAHYTIAIAKERGLTVIADARPAEIDLVKSYGADIVVERGDGFCESIRRHFPSGVDALFDTALLLERALPALRDGGVFLPGRGWTDPPSVRGVRIRPVFVAEAMQRTEWLEALRVMAKEGKIKLRVTKKYPPEDVVDAQRALLAGGLRGRPVIVF